MHSAYKLNKEDDNIQPWHIPFPIWNQSIVPWRRKWQPTPVFWPGESCWQRSLVGCPLWGRTESDMTEGLSSSSSSSSHCSMFGSNCCFLTCTQVSQEAGQVVWYSHLLKNFPQFVIHTVKGFGVVNKAKVDDFLELPCLFDDPADVGNLISGSSAFSKTSLSGSSQFTYCWSLAWRILSITLLACEMCTVVQ